MTAQREELSENERMLYTQVYTIKCEEREKISKKGEMEG